MDVTRTTLTELRDAIADREVSALDATRAYLDRIEQHDSALRSCSQVFADRAIDRARQVDEGKLTGPLAGVPITIKDNLCTAFGHTRCASRMLEHYQSPFTATAVQKLEHAGAIVLGKTNLDEFAMGSSTENSAFGATRNPWDRDYVPGGSSGGAAAAMAADLCAGAIGSDTGGSIRQPAAYCGVVGLKPTYGRVSRWGLVAFASSLDQIGPITRDVPDAALLTQIISGHDPLDSTCANLPVPDMLSQLEDHLDGLRIGIARQYLSDRNHPAVQQAIDRARDIYAALGATLVEVDLPHTQYGIATYYVVATSEASSNLARYDGVHYGHRTPDPADLVELYARSRAQGFGDEVKRRIMLGAYALSSGYYDAYYLRAMKVRRLIKRDFDQAFEQCDAILCPTTTDPAFAFGTKTDDPLAMYMNDIYTVNCNLAGIPGLSLPAGTTTLGQTTLPVGIQLLGKPYDEPRLLRIARMYEREAGYQQLRPTL